MPPRFKENVSDNKESKEFGKMRFKEDLSNK